MNSISRDDVKEMALKDLKNMAKQYHELLTAEDSVYRYKEAVLLDWVVDELDDRGYQVIKTLRIVERR